MLLFTADGVLGELARIIFVNIRWSGWFYFRDSIYVFDLVTVLTQYVDMYIYFEQPVYSVVLCTNRILLHNVISDCMYTWRLR